VSLNSCFVEEAKIILKLFFLLRGARGKKRVMGRGLEELKFLDSFQ